MWAQSRGQKHTHWFVPVALMLIAAVAAILRFWDLGHRSLWIDEAYSWFQANGTFAEVFTRTASDNYPPLHNMVLWAVSGVFGDSETALRAPSAVFATLNVVAVFLLGCRLAGPAAGLLAALLLALSPIEIEQAHQVRMYAMFSLAATLHLWAMLGFLERPSMRRAWLCAVTGTVVLYSHLYGTFLFAASAVTLTAILLARGWPARGALLRLIATQSVAAIIFLPWLVVLARRAMTVVDGSFWIPLPDAGYLLENTLRVIPAPAAILILLALAAWIVLHSRRREGGAAILLMLLAILGPLAIALALSFAVKPILIDRYMIFAGPLAFALGAAALVRLPVPQLLQAAAVLAVAGFMLLPARAAVSFDPPWFSDWRALVAGQKSMMREGDSTVVFPPNAVHAYRYYAGPVELAADLQTPEEIVRPLQFETRLWIVQRLTQPGLGDEIVAAYLAAGHRLVGRYDFKNCSLILFSHQ